jgi:hypothetical protein
MRLSIKEVRFCMRNVRTRMPFKYGVATLTSVPILHLSAVERQGCRQQHGSLYCSLGDSLVLDIGAGAIDVSSLQVAGLGARVEVDVESMVPLDEWEFASLA